VLVWGRRVEAGPCQSPGRCWHGHRRRELHGLALSVRRESDRTFCLERAMPNARRVNTVYRSISRPLTILGAERKLFFFAMCIGAATFNLLAIREDGSKGALASSCLYIHCQ
jgi:hypothetical protein